MGIENPTMMAIFAPIIAICFILWAAYSFMKGYLNHATVKPFKIPDRFDLGYIDDPIVPPAVYTNITIQQPIALPNPSAAVASPAPAPAPAAVPVVDSQLKAQCVAALIGLGYSKTRADKVADQTFQACPDTADVSDFLKKVLAI